MRNITRVTKTVRHLLRTDRTSGFDGQAVVAPGSHRPGRVYVPRLNFVATPKLPTAPSDRDNLVGKAAGCAFFCDSSFFDADQWWRELLGSPNEIVLIPHVMEEQREWLERSSQATSAQAISSSNPKLVL